MDLPAPTPPTPMPGPAHEAAGGGEVRGGLARPLPRRALIALDALAALGFMVALPSFATLAQPDAAVPAWARVLLGAGVSLPVALRRVWPVGVFMVVLTFTVAATLLAVTPDPFIAASYALYTVALDAPRPRRVPPLTLGVASIILVTLLAGSGVALPAASSVPPGGSPGWADEVGVLVFGVAVMGGTWTVGRAVGDRRRAAAEAAAQLAARAVTQERLRIARELHDIVAHSMSLIAVKAGVANHVITVRPGEAQDALQVIEQTSRAALTELRHLLGVLRAEAPDPAAGRPVGAAASPPPAELGPTPGLAGLRGLADRAALAGVRAELDIRGIPQPPEPSGLPEGVELSVYRIVQEALTNVVKHAAPARCRVRVGAAGGAVTVEVVDDGPGVRVLPETPKTPVAARGRAEGGGHGLVGMRERAAMYGGSLTAGPRPSGGFQVTATIPYGDAG